MTAPVIEQRRKGRNGLQTMLIPNVAMVARQIVAVPRGQTRSLGQVRAALAEKYGADACCPVTTQRHLRGIAAQAVAAIAAGNRPPDAVTPFWRVVDPDRSTTRRLAGGAEFVRERLKAER